MSKFAAAAAAVAALAAACGGSDSATGLDKPSLSLLSTVPQPGGVNDRWADLHFTFSAPVDWTALVYVDCTSPGCRTPHVPYRFTSNGVDVVGTPIMPPEFGQTYSLIVAPLATNPTIASNIGFSWTTAPPVTTVTADVTADTTFTIAGSPYFVASGVLVKAALTIQPGVEVSGDLVASGAGSVTAIGLPSSHVRISNSIFNAPGRLSYVDMPGAISVSAKDVDHARIDGANIVGPGVLRMDISGSLTDSRVAGVIVRTLGPDTERNVFLGSTVQLGGDFGIIAHRTDPNPATRWPAGTRFVNNYVDWFGGPGAAYSGIGTVFSVQASDATIRGNSFVRLDAGRAQPATGAAADLSGNYWGTTDSAACAGYFANGYGGAVPNVAPLLAAPDPTTPTP
jgi:hypothetical protein